MEFAKQMDQDSVTDAEKERLVEGAHREEVCKKSLTRNMLPVGRLLAILLACGFYSRWR